MGYDIYVCLLHGFKIPLRVAIECDLINKDILESDDYQLISDAECRDQIITQWVMSQPLREFLLEYNTWNLYILTTSQGDPDIDNSYLFLYDEKIECCNGKAPDYATNTVNIPDFIRSISDLLEEHYLRKLLKIKMPPDWSWNSDLHWVVESSW